MVKFSQTRPELTLNATEKPTGHWGPLVLDKYVAPELSSLTVCSAPPIDEPPKHFVTMMLNHISNVVGVRDELLPHAAVFLRRVWVAVDEYRSGREGLQQYVADLPRTNKQTMLFLSALSHFDHCIINGYVAQVTLERLFKHATSGKTFSDFQRGDGSVLDRVRELYDSVRHFDDRVVAGKPSEHPAPMWITNDGLKCRPRGSGKPPVTVTFSELVEFLDSLSENARIIADPGYQAELVANQ